MLAPEVKGKALLLLYHRHNLYALYPLHSIVPFVSNVRTLRYPGSDRAPNVRSGVSLKYKIQIIAHLAFGSSLCTRCLPAKDKAS